MFFCLGSKGSNGFLFRNGWFHWFSVWELKVQMVPYLESGGSNVFQIGRAACRERVLISVVAV